MYGIYINCSRAPFVSLILARVKSYETRPRDMLRALIGERVAIIETGRGPATIKGYATITRAETVGYSNARARKAAQIIGTPYDVRPGGKKVFYSLTDVEAVAPYPVPADHVNHGRSYTEFSPPNL